MTLSGSDQKAATPPPQPGEPTLGGVTRDWTAVTGPAAPAVSLVPPPVATPAHASPFALPEFTAGREPAQFAAPPPLRANADGDETRIIGAPPQGPAVPPPPTPPGMAGRAERRPLIAPPKPYEEPPKPMAAAIQPSGSQHRRKTLRSRAARNPMVVVLDGLMTIGVILALVLSIIAFEGRQEFELPGPLNAVTTVLIPPKKSRDDIGDILEQAGVISDKTVFVYGSMIAQISDLKAGEYEFKPHATMREVAEAMQQGHVIRHKLTFPEGWTSEQIVQKIQENPILTGKITAIPEEGALQPNTYFFARGDTRDSVLNLMRKDQERLVQDIWARRNVDLLAKLKSPRDLVTLASIIEKETSHADERARIAGVFVNRLNKGMRLETDPTVLYGIYGGKAFLEPRTITRSDLGTPSPYNTYKFNGLPPGPISNPGRASLEAAANPQVSSELFFVADGTGGHAFAETLEEHKKNVDRWREIEKGRRATDPGAAPSPAVPPPAAPNAAVPGVAAPRQPAATAVAPPPTGPTPAATTRQPPATPPAAQVPVRAQPAKPKLQRPSTPADPIPTDQLAPIPN